MINALRVTFNYALIMVIQRIDYNLQINFIGEIMHCFKGPFGQTITGTAKADAMCHVWSHFGLGHTKPSFNVNMVGWRGKNVNTAHGNQVLRIKVA